MTNQSLPKTAQQVLNAGLIECRNLGLMLDKFAPWASDQRGQWDLTIQQTVRRKGTSKVTSVRGGEAKGLWLSTTRKAAKGETPSVFEQERVDIPLMRHHQSRWLKLIKDNDGQAFQMQTAERMAAGLGAAHVLETGLTLERNTGLPYLPASTVKGLARAWGLIEVAGQFGIELDDTVNYNSESVKKLNLLASILIGESEEELYRELEEHINPLSDDIALFVQGFRFIFGSQVNAGAIAFTDGIYYGQDEPNYAIDVMTPHYVNYYSDNGSQFPSEEDSPNPVSFITVDARNTFAFGLIPRQSAFRSMNSEQQKEQKAIMLSAARDWLVNALTQLGAGSKTAASYGFFRKKSFKVLQLREA